MNRVYLTGEITDSSVAKLEKQMRKLHTKNASKERLLILCSSSGGEVDAGFHLISVIRELRDAGTPVDMHVTSKCESMAATVLQSVDRRTIDPMARILMHEIMLSYDQEPVSRVLADAKFIMAESKRMFEYIDIRSGKRKGYWRRKVRHLNYMIDAPTALREGLVDEITSLPSPKNGEKENGQVSPSV